MNICQSSGTKVSVGPSPVMVLQEATAPLSGSPNPASATDSDSARFVIMKKWIADCDEKNTDAEMNKDEPNCMSSCPGLPLLKRLIYVQWQGWSGAYCTKASPVLAKEPPSCPTQTSRIRRHGRQFSPPHSALAAPTRDINWKVVGSADDDKLFWDRPQSPMDLQQIKHVVMGTKKEMTAQNQATDPANKSPFRFPLLLIARWRST